MRAGWRRKSVKSQPTDLSDNHVSRRPTNHPVRREVRLCPHYAHREAPIARAGRLNRAHAASAKPPPPAPTPPSASATSSPVAPMRRHLSRLRACVIVTTAATSRLTCVCR